LSVANGKLPINRYIHTANKQIDCYLMPGASAAELKHEKHEQLLIS